MQAHHDFLGPEVQKVLGALQPGQFSPVIKAAWGCCIVMRKKRPDQDTLSIVRMREELRGGPDDRELDAWQRRAKGQVSRGYAPAYATVKFGTSNSSAASYRGGNSRKGAGYFVHAIAGGPRAKTRVTGPGCRRRAARQRLIQVYGAYGQRAMIVAMAVMWMVQVTIDQVIHMIAMRNRFVTASWAVDMPCFMTFALMFRGASVRIVLGYLNDVLRNVAGHLRVEQFSTVEVINMSLMDYWRMPALGTVNVGRFFRSLLRHDVSLAFL